MYYVSSFKLLYHNKTSPCIPHSIYVFGSIQSGNSVKHTLSVSRLKSYVLNKTAMVKNSGISGFYFSIALQCCKERGIIFSVRPV